MVFPVVVALETEVRGGRRGLLKSPVCALFELAAAAAVPFFAGVGCWYVGEFYGDDK